MLTSSRDQKGRVKELLVRPERYREGWARPSCGWTTAGCRPAWPAPRPERASRQSLLAQAKADLRVTEATVDAGIASAKLGVAAAQARLARAEAQQGEAKAQLDKLLAGARSEDLESARARLATAKALQELYALEVTQSEQLVGEGIDSAHILQVKKTQLTTQKNAVREAELDLARMEAGPTDEDKRISQQQLAAREADLSLAKAQLQQAHAELDRANAMKAQVDLGQAHVAAAEADLEVAASAADAARVALGQMTIQSTVDGTVMRTFDKVGELCREGEVTMQVSDDSEGRWIEGYVSERDAARVRPGQKASVEIVIGSGHTTQAEVEAVSLATNSLRRDDSGAAAAPAVGSAEQVWVKLRPMEQDPRWLPGNSARAVIITE